MDEIIHILREQCFNSNLSEVVGEINRILRGRRHDKIDVERSYINSNHIIPPTIDNNISHIDGMIILRTGESKYIYINQYELREALGESYLESSKEKIKDTILKIIEDKCK